MIFNEIYSVYYNTVAKILSAILSGEASEKELVRIISENAFGESVLTVLPSLKSEKWQLMQSDLTTSIRYKPTMPLTVVEKQWLKAISLDRRIRLFGVEFEGLEDVEPLFTTDDYVIYDQYADGDHYEDPDYIAHFRTILGAMRNGQNIKLEMINRKGRTVYVRCIPERLEYSEKDDKFRLVTAGCRFVKTVNLARITKCNLYNGETLLKATRPEPLHDTVTLKVYDRRNAPERCMLHFAHFEKRVEKLDDTQYLLHIRYEHDDEPEMIIRVLSFGPNVEVIEPPALRQAVIDKLKSQKSCELS